MMWKRSEIRAARQRHLKPVLEALGYRLEPLKNGNYRVLGLADDVVIKDHFWICQGNGTAGNAVDFLVKVQGMAFRDVMRLLSKEELLTEPSAS